MNASQVLAELEAAGVRLWVDGDDLRYRAPRGALTPGLREAVAAVRADLLRALTPAPPAPLPAGAKGAWLRDLDEALLAVAREYAAGPTPPPREAAALGADVDEGDAERAAIMEYDAGLPRAEAERLARASTRPRAAVYQYRLTDNPAQELVFIAPGESLDQARPS